VCVARTGSPVQIPTNLPSLRGRGAVNFRAARTLALGVDQEDDSGRGLGRCAAAQLSLRRRVCGAAVAGARCEAVAWPQRPARVVLRPIPALEQRAATRDDGAGHVAVVGPILAEIVPGI